MFGIILISIISSVKLLSCVAGNAYSSGAPDITSGFRKGLCCPVIYVSLFHMIVLSFEF